MRLQFDDNEYYLVDKNNDTIATTVKLLLKEDGYMKKLSKQNCDGVFGVVDVNSEVETIVKTICPDDRGKDVIYGTGMAVGIQCFNKAMELQKDKLFTIEDMIDVLNTYLNDPFDVYDYVENKIQSLQQTKEIEVEIVTEPMNIDEIRDQGKGFLNSDTNKPKLDENGCLIIKKK